MNELPDTELINQDTLDMDIADDASYLRMMSKANSEAARAVELAENELQSALRVIRERLLGGGRLVYCGAGTSGRLGVLDASECPPTFGVSDNVVVGVMAGGDRALRYSSESIEDHPEIGEEDMRAISLCERDALVAIAASGRTPYCLGALAYAKRVGAAAIALVCSEHSKMAQEAELTVVLKTGPEPLTGSTRLKAGTATKMAINALSTGAMIGLGKVYRNLMVDMRASNEKLRARAVRMLRTATGMDTDHRAQELLRAADGSVKRAIVMENEGVTAREADALLQARGGHVRTRDERCII